MNNYSLDNIFGLQNRKLYMGISILWIICYHFYLVTQSFFDENLYFLKLLFRNGYVGVDVFFILSSYGLCCSLERSSIRKYYKKIFFRIIPIYVIFLVVCKFLLHIDKGFFYDSFLQMSSLSIFNTQFTKPVSMGGEWFVPAIINLYIVFPIIYKVIKLILNKYSYGGYVVIILSILSTEFLRDYISPNYVVRFPIIVCGVLTYLYLKKGDYKKLCHVYFLMIIFAFIMVRTNVILSLIVPIVLKCLNDMDFKSDNRLLDFCGTISFELYLSHVIPMNFCSDKNILHSFAIMFFGTLILCFVFVKVNSLVRKFN